MPTAADLRSALGCFDLVLHPVTFAFYAARGVKGYGSIRVKATLQLREVFGLAQKQGWLKQCVWRRWIILI